MYSGIPFTVASSATSLNLPGSNQVADKVKSDVEILGGIGPGQSWFGPARVSGRYRAALR